MSTQLIDIQLLVPSTSPYILEMRVLKQDERLRFGTRSLVLYKTDKFKMFSIDCPGISTNEVYVHGLDKTRDGDVVTMPYSTVTELQEMANFIQEAELAINTGKVTNPKGTLGKRILEIHKELAIGSSIAIQVKVEPCRDIDHKACNTGTMRSWCTKCDIDMVWSYDAGRFLVDKTRVNRKGA